MLRVFEAFSGIGTQRMALRNLGIEHEVVCIAEIDKFAIRSYEAIHGETLNLGDVSKIDPNDVPDHDLFTYSFPCQDISVAGKGKGFKPESGTRSSLLWECEKIIEAKRPKYLLMENVKALIFKKFKPGFEKWLRLLEELGYTNYWQVLNAKDYGIPQNRERVFCVSILGTHEPYVFPKKQELILRLKDVLEDEVDERFYINNERADKLIKQLVDKRQLENLEGSEGAILSNQAMTGVIEIDSGGDKRVAELNRLGNIYGEDKGTGYAGNVWDKEGLCPTLITMEGGNREPMIVASRGRNPNNPSDRTPGSPTEQRLEVNKQGISNTITSVQKDNLVLEPIVCEQRTDEGLRFFKGGVVGTLRTIDSCGDKRVLEPKELKFVGGLGSKDWVGDGKEFSRNYPQGNRVYDSEGIACSQTAQGGGIGSFTGLYVTDYRIRKLTPKECWRLMGISDEDFEKAQEVNSNTQLYKQAGNAIVVDVLEGIFRKLFLSKSKEKGNKLEEQLEWLDDLLGVGT